MKEKKEELKPVEQVEESKTFKGVVTASILNVRQGPSFEAYPIGTLYEGDEVELAENLGEWYKLKNGGYCKSEFISSIVEE